MRVPTDQTHALLKTHFENSRRIDEGAYLRPYKKLLVDVTVSKTCLDKALTFANDLFNAFELVGHRVVIAPSGEGLRRAAIDEREVAKKQRDPYGHSGLWSPDRPTVVYLGTVPVGLAVVEMSEEVLAQICARHLYPRIKVCPSKELTLFPRLYLDDHAGNPLRPASARSLFAILAGELVDAVAGISQIVVGFADENDCEGRRGLDGRAYLQTGGG